MLLQPSQTEVADIIGFIRPIFRQHHGRFDSTKYPDAAYKAFSAAFQTPVKVLPQHMSDALIWKYGHSTKRDRSKIPRSHKALIFRLSAVWQARAGTFVTPEAAFECLHRTEGVAYITSAFLTHLTFPSKPIIDQHNFRAMNDLLRRVRPGAKIRLGPPRSYQDLLNLQNFMAAVLGGWPNSDPPCERDFDKFLMAYGKSIKIKTVRRTKALPAKNGRGQINEPPKGSSGTRRTK